MGSKLNRRALLRWTGAAATLNLAALSARADDTTPEMPTTPMPPVEAYAAPPFVDEIALSPDGTRIALVSQRGDQKILTHMKIGDQASQPVSLGNSKIRALLFGDNDHVVLVTSVTMAAGGKYELSGASIIDLNTVKARTMEVSDNIFMGLRFRDTRRVKIDGQYRVTAAGVSSDGHGSSVVNLYAFDMIKGSPRLLDKGTHDTEGWVVMPDGFPLAYSEYSDATKAWLLYFNQSQRGEQNHFTKIYDMKGALTTPDVLGPGRDGKSVVVFLNGGDDEGTYHEISADGVLGPSLDIKAATSDSTALFSPVTGFLAGFGHHTDWFTYNYFDPLMRKLAEGLNVAMGDDIRAAIVEFAEDPRKMIIYAESASDAGGYFFIDFSTGDSQRLASQYPGVPADWVTQKSAINYKAADGLDIHGYLTLPPYRPAKNLPLVVLPHGGPQSRDYIDFDWQAQVLASRGYAVLQPNFRGSTGYGLDFVKKGHGEWGRKMQSDLSDGVRWLAQQGTVDAKRVAILGASYGGYAALAGATLDTGVYCCAVAVAGPSDLGVMVRQTAMQAGSNNTDAVIYWKQFMGDPALYDDISPARQASRAYCPILLLHGNDDTVVPIEQSQRMESALKAAGKPVEFIAYPGQDHWETAGDGAHRDDEGGPGVSRQIQPSMTESVKSERNFVRRL